MTGTLMPDDRTADQALNVALTKICGELCTVEERLSTYANEENPHWGHVGDLNYILEQLETINRKK